MRRAVLALVVTVVAVVLLAGYDTHPPRMANPQAALRPPARHAPAPKPGTRTARGPLMTTPFSVIQVEATLTHGRLTGVRTVYLTGDGPHTEALNARAEPILRREALRAGSADVDVVSGATYTSESWKRSLQAAIDRARG
ncbi:MAG: hypothetical protein QOI62_3054 [Solirubrobacteraceae bacterium]|nr:hypothetical protein [Solirubrobacteraceae bacterium]MEA2276057.1 hypothetical protein [Solirubrobacteraceae bacterium]MEA2359794.1 hypothetical protein [Solirubrobacteraceae bacterium]MEA2394126.1 hypothetical protein [Solirubrobacteraceae bacterium]